MGILQCAKAKTVRNNVGFSLFLEVAKIDP
jgi:hypothetical protein